MKMPRFYSVPTLLILGSIILIGALLRFIAITQNPPGLYLDEIAIGQNAYSILTKGQDEYGTAFPLSFKSFGDYKMPVYIYLTALSMAVFGKSELAIRFPSALFGTLTIPMVFLITRELLLRKKYETAAATVGLLAAGSIAFLPWHIHFSRGGFEVTVALFFYCVGIYLGLRYWKTASLRIGVVAIVFFILAMYTYHSYRVRVPLTLLTAFGTFIYVDRQRFFRHFLLLSSLALCLALPLLLFSLSSEGQSRLLQTSAFRDDAVDPIVGIFTNVLIFLTNYTSFFSLTYLFHLGDQITRHQIPNFGLLYLWQLPMIILGFIYLAKTQNKLLRVTLVALFIIGPIPAALAVPSPHTLRYLFGAVIYSIMTAIGMYVFFTSSFPYKKGAVLFLGGILLLQGLYYFDYYFIQYPNEAQLDWGASCKEIANYIRTEKQRTSHIVIDKNLDCIPEYFTFYIPSIPLTYADPNWVKPSSWKDGTTLYIRPFYGKKNPDHLVKTFYLRDKTRTIFSQVEQL